MSFGDSFKFTLGGKQKSKMLQLKFRLMEKDGDGLGDLSVPFPNVDAILCLLLCSILETKIPVTWDKGRRTGRAFLCKRGQLLLIRFFP